MATPSQYMRKHQEGMFIKAAFQLQFKGQITLECCTKACKQKSSTVSEGILLSVSQYGSPLPPKHHKPP